MSKIQLNATSGGGSVSIQAPSSSGSDSVFTINGTANGLIHTTTLGPAFFARNNNSQSISNGSTSKVQFNNEIFDTDNCYSTSNYRFTPNLAGYYLIRGNVAIASMNGTMGVNIYKNGSRFVNMDNQQNRSGGQNLCITGLVPMNGSSDYVEIFVFQSSGATRSLVNGTQFSVTEFSGMFVRSLA